MIEADILIIGAGPGGYATAAKGAAAGKRVVLFERDELGGTCLNRGCIPTKALCRSAEVALTVAEAAEFGVSVGDIRMDYARAAARKDEIVGQLREGVESLLQGVEVVRGEARFSSPSVVECSGESYTAPTIVVATGSRSAELAIPGAELAVHSDFVLAMSELPESMAIIGGGVIGMEFASIFSAFGVKVTVLEYCPEILPPFDPEIAKRLRMSMKRRGVDIVTSARVTAITGDMTVEAEVKGKPKSFSADMVLTAVGRRAVLPAGLEDTGIELNRGFIKVTPATMESSVKGIYAIGDANGLCLLAHAAEAQGERLLGHEVNLDVIPSAVFTSPECAMVGLTEPQAIEAGMDFKVGKATFRANGKALAMGEPDGLIKILTAADGRMLGCHICGPHAADMIQEAALAIASGQPTASVVSTIHGHPTLSETLAAAARASL